MKKLKFLKLKSLKLYYESGSSFLRKSVLYPSLKEYIKVDIEQYVIIHTGVQIKFNPYLAKDNNLWHPKL